MCWLKGRSFHVEYVVAKYCGGGEEVGFERFIAMILHEEIRPRGMRERERERGKKKTPTQVNCSFFLSLLLLFSCSTLLFSSHTPLSV